MKKTQSIVFVLCIALHHLCTGGVGASLAAAEQQQQGTLAGLELDTQRTLKGPAYAGYMSHAPQNYEPVMQQPTSAAAVPASLAAYNPMQAADSSAAALPASTARSKRRRQRQQQWQASQPLPAYAAAEWADLMGTGLLPVAAGGASSSSSSSSADSTAGSSSSTSPVARQHRQHHRQQQQQIVDPAAASGSTPDPLLQPQYAMHEPASLNHSSSSSSSSSKQHSAPPHTVAAGSSSLPKVVATSRSKKQGPGRPLSGLPVNSRPVGPRPPCNSSRGFEERDGTCVCMPGYGAAVGRSNLCVQCVIGWFSAGGSVGSARCRRCPDGTSSNPTRTACVSIIEYPDVNEALCKPCANRNEPFRPPSCCGRGQVCCGMWGCCDSDICFNNATTGNQPFCGAGPRCTVSGGTTPAEGAGPMSLCPVNTDCVNITLPTTTTRCCRRGSQCVLGSTVRCCNPDTEFCYRTTTVSGTTVTTQAACCENGRVICEGEGNCCALGSSCVNNQRCCLSPVAGICFPTTNNVLAANPTLACCEPSAGSCLMSASGMSLCCPVPKNEVCGSTCCQTLPAGLVEECLYGSVCCAVNKVCPNPGNPSQKTCCSASQNCNFATGVCV